MSDSGRAARKIRRRALARRTTCSASATTCAKGPCAFAIPRAVPTPRRNRMASPIYSNCPPCSARQRGWSETKPVRRSCEDCCAPEARSAAPGQRHVMYGEGRLAIAKFPRPGDEWDVMRWEAVALALARAAGISIPDFVLHEIDGKAVLIVDRFDRVGERRIGYVSGRRRVAAAVAPHRLLGADLQHRRRPHRRPDRGGRVLSARRRGAARTLAEVESAVRGGGRRLARRVSLQPRSSGSPPPSNTSRPRRLGLWVELLVRCSRGA